MTDRSAEKETAQNFAPARTNYDLLSPWHTGTVSVDGVPQAFTDLGNPEQHAKILVVPS